MNVILIGFMGAGKSTVGHLLANKLEMNYLDADELIEKTDGRTISQIFAEEGEGYFRDLETEVVKTLQDYDNFILSTGGGMVLRQENVALLHEIGPLIYLAADPATLFQRVKGQTHRPLLQVPDPQAEVSKLLSARLPAYEGAADLKIDTARLTPEQVAEEIIKWLRSK